MEISYCHIAHAKIENKIDIVAYFKTPLRTNMKSAVRIPLGLGSIYTR